MIQDALNFINYATKSLDCFDVNDWTIEEAINYIIDVETALWRARIILEREINHK